VVFCFSPELARRLSFTHYSEAQKNIGAAKKPDIPTGSRHPDLGEIAQEGAHVAARRPVGIRIPGLTRLPPAVLCLRQLHFYACYFLLCDD
jgi:hypothetical protein